MPGPAIPQAAPWKTVSNADGTRTWREGNHAVAARGQLMYLEPTNWLEGDH
eukprot:gene48412-1286_t